MGNRILFPAAKKIVNELEVMSQARPVGLFGEGTQFTLAGQVYSVILKMNENKRNLTFMLSYIITFLNLGTNYYLC